MRNRIFALLLWLAPVCLFAQTWEDYMQASSRYRMYGNDSCFIMIDKAIEAAPDQDKRSLSKIFKGDSYMRFAQWDEGINQLHRVLSEDSLSLTHSLKAKAYNGLAILYQGKQAFDKLVLYGQMALDFALLSSDTVQIIDAYVNLYRASVHLEDQKQANVYGMTAMDHALGFKDKIKLYKVAHNLFSKNIDAIDQEPIASYLVRFIERTKPKELPADGYHTGFQFLKQYNISLAQWESLYDQLIKNKSPNIYSLGIRYSHALQDAGLNDQAMFLNDSLYQKALIIGDLVSAKILAHQNYNVSKNLKDHQKANEYLEIYYKLKDSLQNSEIQHKVNELNIQFETARKDQEIAQQEVEILNNQRQRNFLVGGILGILLLSSFVVFTIRKRHGYQVQLAEREKEIQSQKIQKLEQEQKIMALDYMLMGEENERKRIAKDLHDSLGALLASTKLQLKKLHQDLVVVTDDSLFQKTEAMIDQAAEEVRRISHAMMPDALVNLGMKAAIEDLATNINEGGEVQVTTYFFDVDETQFTDQQKVGIYRIIQELCQNILKHAQASHAVVQLTREKDALKLEVEDDGIGFVPNDLTGPKGIGLQNIESRVKYLDGKMDVESKKGGPTNFTIKIPV